MASKRRVEERLSGKHALCLGASLVPSLHLCRTALVRAVVDRHWHGVGSVSAAALRRRLPHRRLLHRCVPTQRRKVVSLLLLGPGTARLA